MRMARKLIKSIFLAILLAEATGIGEIQNFLEDIQKIYKPFQLEAYMCLDYDETVRLFQAATFQFRYNLLNNTTQLRTDGLPHLTLFLIDLKCEDAFGFVENAKIVSFFQHPYRWIMLGANLKDIPNIAAFVDSDILCADDDFQLWNSLTCKKDWENNNFSECNNQPQLDHFLRPSLRLRLASPYIIEYFGNWDPNTGLRLCQTALILSRRRKNLQKTPLQASIVIIHDQSMNHLEDYQEKHIDSIGKVNFVITKIIVDSLNATLTYNRVKTWGYQNPKFGNWSGMIGELVTRRSNLGGTSLFLQPNRIRIIEYLSMVTPTRSKFIFRRPPLSSVSNIYSLPFTMQVWIIGGCLVLLTVFVIFIMMKIQTKIFDDEDHSALDPTGAFGRFTDCVMVGISAISQMGLLLRPRSISLRIASIFLLNVLLFLYTSYTANIVALLQSTTKTITTLTDLLYSNLEIALDDNPYNRYYFPAATEPIHRKIYETRILTSKGGSFLNSSTGIQRVRNEPFAFHIELSVGYELIEKTFYEHEKCNLQTIEFIQVIDPWYAIQKNSSFKEMIKVTLFKIREHGIQSRENGKIYTDQPTCTAHGQNFASVRLQECYGAFLILVAGFGLSAVFFLVEKCWSDARICRI